MTESLVKCTGTTHQRYSTSALTDDRVAAEKLEGIISTNWVSAIESGSYECRGGLWMNEPNHESRSEKKADSIKMMIITSTD